MTTVLVLLACLDRILRSSKVASFGPPIFIGLIAITAGLEKVVGGAP